MAEMSKRERLEATIAGQPVDRVAVALWRHFPGDDQDPAELAASTLWFQQQYDWDFVKVSPSSSFCLQDWGVRDEWVGGDEGTRDYTVRAVCEPEDWERLPVLDPQQGYLGQQLRCLDLVRAGLGDPRPVHPDHLQPAEPGEEPVRLGQSVWLHPAKSRPGAAHARDHHREHHPVRPCLSAAGDLRSLLRHPVRDHRSAHRG